MDEENTVESYNGIFGNKKEWSTDTHYKIYEQQKNYTKWKKPHTETTYCMILFMWNVQDMEIYRDRK